MRTPLHFTTSPIIALALCLSSAAGISLSSQAPGLDESQIRAVMIVNLTKFIEWPPARSETRSPFIICTVGNDQVGPDLEVLLLGKTVQGRAVLVRRGITPEEVEPCHILYVPRPRYKQMNDLAARLANSSTLTISEEHAARSGTVIGLPLVDGHVQIEINRRLAQASTLTVSSHLLQIATESR